MKDLLISEKRAQYMPLGLKQFCFGNKSVCSVFSEDGAVIMPWGKIPEDDEANTIECLRLIPSQIQIKKAKLPSFVRNLQKLKFLEISLPTVVGLKQDSLPVELKTLMISNGVGQVELLKENNQSLVWPDVALSSLKGLWFFDGFGAHELSNLLNISQKFFPCLEYLECVVGSNNKIIETLKKFKSLQFLHIGNICSSDLFIQLSNSLQYLSIIGAKKDFKISEISHLKRVKSLWINDIRTEIDCRIFTLLPDLIEINVLNSKKILNVDSLLNCAKLKNIYFLNCNKPFRAASDKFITMSYDRFDIKYS